MVVDLVPVFLVLLVVVGYCVCVGRGWAGG